MRADSTTREPGNLGTRPFRVKGYEAVYFIETDFIPFPDACGSGYRLFYAGGFLTPDWLDEWSLTT
jgi:hypothetical protein